MPDASSIAVLYKAISTGNRIQMELPDKAAFDSIRTALCRMHRTPKALDLIDGSVCASFDEDSGAAIFYVGARKGRAKLAFTIIQVDDNSSVEQTDA
jgi:hypothetical protein